MSKKPHNNATHGERSSHVVGRRRVVQALGIGTAIIGSSGVAGARAMDEHRDDTIDRNDEDVNDRSEDVVDPMFGFSAPSGEVEPPVEPDHVVEAVIQPRPDHEEIPAFFFEPTGLFVEPGDTVQFSLSSPHHSVTAFHPGFGTQQRVPDGVPPFSSPVLPVGSYWLYTFEVPGVYDLHCGPHEFFGHVARLVVGEVAGPGAEPVPTPVPEHGADNDVENEINGHKNGDENHVGEGEEPAGEPDLRPPVGTAATVLNDPALEPESIVERGRVSWEEIDEANKALMPLV